jgi:hypothetical protein
MKVLNIKCLLVLISCTSLFWVGCDQASTQNHAQKPADSTQTDSLGKRQTDIPLTSSDTATKNVRTAIQIKDAKYNDFARLVAGLPLEANSPFKKYIETENYKTFASDLDKSWAKIEQSRFSKMREWAKTELAMANNDHTDLFYPFSGPDFVNAYQLFPKADNYTLIGLETIIPFPDLATYNAKMVDNYFFSVAESIEDLLEKSYFLTRRMAKDFQRGKAEGILPALCLFIVRTGHTITDIQQVGLDDDGRLTLSHIDSARGKAIKGVKVSFFNPSENRLKNVYYFRQDASDSGLKQNPSFLKFMQNLPICNAYFKSASYLLHFPYFTVMRPIVLEKARFILQDDTGMPFRFLERAKWELTVYGTYDKPIKDFKYMGQRDFKTYFDSLKALNAVKPMPFDLGYHWGTKDNNLIRAVKK